MHRANTRAAVALVAALTAAACTDGGDESTATTTTVAVTVNTTEVESDGVLRIGVLLPRTGAGAQLGRPMIDAVGVAADRINNAGGVNGRDVVLVEGVDEGDTVTSAASGFDTLLREDVDAIVGPASSLAALATLDAPVDAGKVTCSPTATALSLDEYPDEGLFFRTVPSDSLQARAIASEAESTGARTLTIGHLDDPYGRGLAEALETAVAAQGVELLRTVPFASNELQLEDEAADLVADDPGIIVVLGDADDGSRLVAALAEVVDRRDPPTILVNDALRDPASQPVMRDLPRSVRNQVVGLAPLAESTDEELLGPYAANAYDCVILIALAAVQAGTDSPAEIAVQIPSVSVGGSQCHNFDACVQRLLDDREIDYDGPSGNTALSNRTGDPITGQFERFTFDEEGQDVAGESLAVTAE